MVAGLREERCSPDPVRGAEALAWEAGNASVAAGASATGVEAGAGDVRVSSLGRESGSCEGVVAPEESASSAESSVPEASTEASAPRTGSGEQRSSRKPATMVGALGESQGALWDE